MPRQRSGRPGHDRCRSDAPRLPLALCLTAARGGRQICGEICLASHDKRGRMFLLGRNDRKRHQGSWGTSKSLVSKGRFPLAVSMDRLSQRSANSPCVGNQRRVWKKEPKGVPNEVAEVQRRGDHLLGE